MADKKDKIIDAIIDFGGSAASGAVGAGIGLVAAGPAGAAIGSIAGTVVEKIFQAIGKDVKERRLSQNENRRIGTVFGKAEAYVGENIQAGKKIRTDHFFVDQLDDRSPADELLENLLFTSQKEIEERKLPYMAKLYANILFDNSKTWGENIDRETANQLIKLVGDMTYRQMVVIGVIGAYQTKKVTTPPRRSSNTGYYDSKFNYIASEVYDLYLKSFIEATEIVPYAAVIKPSTLSLQGYGVAMYNLMELWQLPRDEIVNDVISYFSGVRIKE